MKKHFFSIICPVFNKALYIADAINSVISQNYHSWELIIVDDESTDYSLQIAKSFDYDKRIKIFSERNGGPLKQRLFGVTKSTGDYCLFLDADDTLESNCLSTLNTCLNSYSNLDVIKFMYYWTDNSGNKMRNYHIKFPFYNRELIENDLYEYKKQLLCQSINYISHLCIKKDIIPSPTMYEPYYDSRMSEDLLMQLPIIDNARKVLCIDDRLYCYRVEAIDSSIKAKAIIGNLKNNINPYIVKFLLFYGEKWKMLDETVTAIIYKKQFSALLRMLRKVCLDNDWKSISNDIKKNNWVEIYIGEKSIKHIKKCGLTKKEQNIIFSLSKKNLFLLHLYYIKTKRLKKNLIS